MATRNLLKDVKPSRIETVARSTEKYVFGFITVFLTVTTNKKIL